MGNILPNMSKDEFSRIPIVYPQIDILMKYHNLVKDLFCKIDNGVCTILSLTKQRDELLPLLMNGQVNFDLSANIHTFICISAKNVIPLQNK
jgi:type I restriction enzyme S subunit